MIKFIHLSLAIILSSAFVFRHAESSSAKSRNQPNLNKSAVFADDEVDDDEVNDVGSENSTASQVDIINDYTNDNFNQECLRAHNDLRKRVGSSPLRLSRQIIKFAQKRARRLAKDNDPNNLKHDPEDFGENLMVWPGNGPISCQPIVKMWFDEQKLVSNWSDPEGGGPSTYHFTQVVWKQTKRLGCGAASTEDSGWVFVSCNYDPPGNYLSEFQANVFPPTDEANLEKEMPNEIKGTSSAGKKVQSDGCECVCEVK